MKKRILALILALCLALVTLFTFASCGGEDTPDTPDAPDNSGVENDDPQDSGSEVDGSGDEADTGLVDDDIPEDIAEDIF